MKKSIPKASRKILFIFLLCILLGSAWLNANTRYGRLTGVNWFGFETKNFVVHGIWARDYKSVLQQIADLGFNCIRLPWCNEMIGKNPDSIQINEVGVDPYTNIQGMNLDLEGLSSLEVMDKIIDHAATLGIYIILDNHSRAADGYMNETLWYTSAYSEAKWISDWEMMAKRYKNRSNVIAADLNNEPHGNLTTGMKPPATWGYKESGYGDTDWRGAAERCGKALLAVNPDLLIIIEGVESYKGDGYWWGGNLTGVRDYPITSIPKNNLVYSPHEYGSGVHNQSWFSAPNFPDNMYAIWDKYFYFLEKENIAPILIGEFGITDSAAANSSSTDYIWMKTLMEYMGRKVSWTFWCINPNSGDTGGILQYDWVTVNQPKYNLIKPYLAGKPNPHPATPAPSTPPPTPGRTPTVPPTTATPAGQWARGDVDHNGTVNIVDALMVAQYYVGIVSNGFYPEQGDTNNDGVVNIVDALRIAQAYVGLIQL